MKKLTYNTKTREELIEELATLRSVVRDAVAKPTMGKNNKEYTRARKNIARIMTALQSQAQTSTEA